MVCIQVVSYREPHMVNNGIPLVLMNVCGDETPNL